MKSKHRILALSLALLMLFTVSCGRKKEEVEEDPIKPVVIRTAGIEEHSRDLKISGNIKPGHLVKLAFKVPGTLENVAVKEGDQVAAGQVLMSLNQHDFQIGVNAAQAQHDAIKSEIDGKIGASTEEVEANLNFINTQLDRVRRLHEQGAVSTKTLEELELQKEVVETKLAEINNAKITAESQLKQAASMVELANSKLADTVLTSPVNGTVIKKLSEEGETVIPGYPTLAIGRLDRLEVEIGVPDKAIDKIIVGSTVKVSVKGVGAEVNGVISKIDAAADLETRTFPVTIDIENPEGKLKPGMIADVTINMDKAKALTLPIDAIIDNAEGSFVYVYNEGDKTVSKREVKTGEVYEDLIEIVEGIEAGEDIVIEGQYRLNDQEEVKARREEND